jgi:hypothetical protein
MGALFHVRCHAMAPVWGHTIDFVTFLSITILSTFICLLITVIFS